MSDPITKTRDAEPTSPEWAPNRPMREFVKRFESDGVTWGPLAEAFEVLILELKEERERGDVLEKRIAALELEVEARDALATATAR